MLDGKYHVLYVAVIMGNEEMLTLLLGENPKEADCACKYSLLCVN